tara:strand:- start:498 stop:818 length:321 start_codon:yes stop_codon:yes gene_type:complete
MLDPVILYITINDREEGLRIGRALVEENLCACANVSENVTSVFRWEDEIQEASEAVLIAKTQRQHIDAATDLVKLEHSYDCPCIVAVPIVGGNQKFINWIDTETTA